MSSSTCFPTVSDFGASSSSNPPALGEQLLQKSMFAEQKAQNLSAAELNFLNGNFGTIPASAQLEVLEHKIKIWKKLEHIAIAELNLANLNLVNEVRANTGRGFEGLTVLMKQQVALAEKSLQIVEQNLLVAVIDRQLAELTMKMQML